MRALVFHYIVFLTFAASMKAEKPFDFAEKAYWLQRDVALKAFVDQWLHITTEDGSFRKIYAAWFD